MHSTASAVRQPFSHSTVPPSMPGLLRASSSATGVEPLLGPSAVAIGADFVEALASLELPGNARQLENLIRNALLCKSDVGPLGLSDLPSEILAELASRRRGDGAARSAVAVPVNEHTSTLGAALL